MKITNNKQATARDVILIGALLFVFGSAFFVLNFMMNTTVNQIVNIEAVNQSNTSVSAFQGITSVMNKLPGKMKTAIVQTDSIDPENSARIYLHILCNHWYIDFVLLLLK